jgi:hypothetical protein
MNEQCKLDEHDMKTIFSQELIMGVGLNAEIDFDVTKLGSNLVNGAALAALANGASLLKMVKSTLLLNKTIEQSTRCLETDAPSTSTSTSLPPITPAPTSATLTIPISPTAVTTAMASNPVKKNAAISVVVPAICAGLLVIVAMVFSSL